MIFKINSHKSYWAQMRCNDLSSPFLSSKQGFNWCEWNRAKAWVTSIFGVFHATRGLYLFLFFFCGVQKDISRKKKKKKTAELVCQFTANSPTANSTGWSCLPIRFKREIVTLFLRISKKTVTFALNKVFQSRFSCPKWRIFVAWHRNSKVFDLHFYLVWYKVSAME